MHTLSLSLLGSMLLLNAEERGCQAKSYHAICVDAHLSSIENTARHPKPDASPFPQSPERLTLPVCDASRRSHRCWRISPCLAASSLASTATKRLPVATRSRLPKA